MLEKGSPSIHCLLTAVSVVGKMHRSTSDIDLNQYSGVNRLVNNQESLKDDKKKRGRSPFRLVCVMWHKIPYFSIDKAHLMYNAHPRLLTLYFYLSFVITFDLPLIPF